MNLVFSNSKSLDYLGVLVINITQTYYFFCFETCIFSFLLSFLGVIDRLI
jgi:hypothetical protein